MLKTISYPTSIRNYRANKFLSHLMLPPFLLHSPATTFSFSGPPNVVVTMTAAFIFAVWENGSATSGKKSVATVLDNLRISFQEEVVAVGFFARDLGTSTRATSPFVFTAVKDGMTTEYSFPIDLSEPRSNNAEGAMYFA
jgi:hypothetical protein